jgi:hypothetical protein
MTTISITSTPKMPNISSQLKKGEKLVFINGKWTIMPDMTIKKKGTQRGYDMILNSAMRNNTTLTTGRRKKNDEYYITYDEVAKELVNYTQHFENSIIHCPIDKLNPEKEASILKFFKENIKKYNIKRFVCSYYSSTGNGSVVTISQDGESVYQLKGDGHFTSKECVELMRGCDIVIANPSGSSIRLFIDQLMDLNKKFIFVGDINMVPYKSVFKYIMFGKLFAGYTKPEYFATDLEEVDKPNQYKQNGVVYEKFGNKIWFTNLPVDSKEELALSSSYNPKKYVKYDESDVIEVSKVKDIPYDYDEVMGVPLNFFENYNPAQFEIVGRMNGNTYEGYACFAIINGCQKYQRLLIKRVK